MARGCPEAPCPGADGETRPAPPARPSQAACRVGAQEERPFPVGPPASTPPPTHTHTYTYTCTCQVTRCTSIPVTLAAPAEGERTPAALAARCEGSRRLAALGFEPDEAAVEEGLRRTAAGCRGPPALAPQQPARRPPRHSAPPLTPGRHLSSLEARGGLRSSPQRPSKRGVSHFRPPGTAWAFLKRADLASAEVRYWAARHVAQGYTLPLSVAPPSPSPVARLNRSASQLSSPLVKAMASPALSPTYLRPCTRFSGGR